MECFWDIVYGVRSVWRWFPVIWEDGNFDWAYLAKVMSAKLQMMERASMGWHHVGSERCTREMQICRAILERLVRDEYYNICEPFGKSGDPWVRGRIRLMDRQQRDDAELFGKIMGRKMRGWWD